ncbi:hypothetical protein EDC04DRAFT_3139730 [Pisolithus marmoratus]|nr:hypothetical protein EDC04DRAFT_3139730 [Pisolithus marmoratus]
MSGIGVAPGVPPKRPVYQLSHSSLPSSLSTSDDSLSHSTNTSTCDAGQEAVICSLLARPPTPTPPPRPPRHVARSHDKRPKTAPPSAIGSTRGFVATRVAPPPNPPPTRPLPYPPAQYNHRRLSSGPPHSDTAQTHHHVVTQPPMPILPIFPSRDSSSSSTTSATSPSDTSMLAVPLLHPFAAHEGPPTPKREQSRHSNQCAQLVSSPSPQKHRSKFTLPLISGPSHSPPAPVPFPVQYTPSATSGVLASPHPSHTPAPSSSTPPTFPLSPPPHSLQFACVAPSSSTLPATNAHLSQDSLSDKHCEPPSAPFRLRGPLGHPLVNHPISAAVEIHQLPSSATIRPRPYSTHNKRAKSALRTSQSPHSTVLLNGEDEGQRPQGLGGTLFLI